MEPSTELFDCLNLNPIDSIVDRFRSNIDEGLKHKTAISTFLNDLINHADNIEGQAAIDALQTELVGAFSLLNTKKVPVSAFRDLIASTKKPASDREILTIVINIAKELNKELDPIALMRPVHSTVTGLRKIGEVPGYDKTTASLTDALKSETSGKIYRDVAEFWEVNFITNKPWCGLVNRIWASYRDNGQCGSDNAFSSNMDEDAWRRWLHAFRDRYLIQLMKEEDFTEVHQPSVKRRRNEPLVRGKFCHTTIPSQFKGGKTNRKLDIFIESSEIPDCETHKWRDVRVVGEVTSSVEQIGAKFNQLMRYAREIFYSQPLRRFVHCFCLHKDHIEFWIIDRAGAYSSGEFEVLKTQEMLVRGLSAYMLMSDEELGLDPVISYDDANRCFVTLTNDNSETEKLEVIPRPVARPETIVSRGSTCFKTKDEKYLIKFSWGTGAKDNEIKFLNRAKNVTGVIQMVSSGNLYKVATHRKGVKFSKDKLWIFIAKDQVLARGQQETILNDEFYVKRRLTYVKLTPVGRLIHSAVSVREFVSGIRDAIIGLRNLHGKNIIHGDISSGNIILTGPDKDGKTKGILIDLDMSYLHKNENEKNLPRAITGTTMYMALELLEAITEKKLSLKQTYRHDLESCFYVLIVGCMSYCAKPMPEDLEIWHSCSSKTCYQSKRIMVEDFATKTVHKFLPKFDGVKELALNFHQILFGNKDIGYGSPIDPNLLYNPIIEAFDETILELEAKKDFPKISDCFSALV
ncbi:BgtAc-31486 [Blumeria graminis f. sp. tritici]|uniref:EKC/KEOPS complex subunit BUD32 n=3 Tax=Blumeria graminis f. sp. tritici TaxID=62690 RepID=A0A9X9PRR9_BLUGR|nr:BgtAc-31486 [Blumeria graminis f. sp. tritici]